MMKQPTSVFLIGLLIIFSLAFKTNGVPSVMYLGCYEDGGPSNRLMKGDHEDFHGSLTPDKCNELCRGKGFAYAGTQYSYECFCSKTKPPDSKKRLESDCNSKCAGDESKTCGGNNRLAVFSTGIADPTANDDVIMKSLGCFKDSHNKRLLSGYRQDFPGSLTNHKCVKLCAQRGYPYAGTEYGKECHCGNRRPTFKEYANDEECSKRCEGDGNQLCGGNWRIFVFETSKSDSASPTDDGKYLGCYKDEENARKLDGHTEDFGNFLTPLKCTGLCYSKGFLYSGTQYSYQCFCGDKPPSPNSKVPENQCSKPCSGNPAEICGGETRNSIRETGIPDIPVVDKYLGCFNDQNNQIFKDIKLTFDKTNSPRRCMNFCYQLGFRYSGVEYGKECFCGNNEPKADLVVNPEECSTPCSGDPLESCGSGWRLAVYATNFIESVNPIKHTTSKPCVASETVIPGQTSTVCRGDVVFEEQFTSPLGNRWRHVVMIPDAPTVLVSDEESTLQQKTKRRKRSRNFPNQASTSTVFHEVKTDRNVMWSEKEHHTEEETLEFLGVYIDKIVNTEENRIFGEVIASRIDKLNCQNQASARDRIANLLSELEMEESTNSTGKTKMSYGKPCLHVPDSSTSTTPSSIIQDLDSGEEYEFAVFTSDPKNSFTSKSQLVIKPTFLDDIFVQDGTLHLEGCTGRPNSRQCHLKASSYNILPPVTSARIHTRDSFSFRYGIVEVRAKLPLGDWLVPELWLEPRQNYYGPAYESGRIRIAMIRGNSDLKCKEEDFGSNRLESGVMMGPTDNVQRRSLNTKLPENWHDRFHNYTLIWAPDSISFKIDNQQAQQLVPSGRRLCEVIGFTNEQCLTWSSGSRIAPFDKDFYISLGLSVGNARDFPDGCTNKGRPKPWRNLEQKALLKFWLDRANWKATWSEENSSLYIESIRVTAL